MRSLLPRITNICSGRHSRIRVVSRRDCQAHPFAVRRQFLVVAVSATEFLDLEPGRVRRRKMLLGEDLLDSFAAMIQ